MAWRSHRLLMVMIAPAIAYFLIFHYAPMLGIVMAFQDYNLSRGVFGSDWVGWANFRSIFAGGEFLQILRNTIIVSGTKFVAGFFAPIVLALMLNELRSASFRRFVQTASYLPYLFSWVILGGIFLMFFSAGGPVNRALDAAVGIKVPFFSDSVWFLAMVVFTHVWQTAGYGAVIYLAALAGISPQLYEAARIDGAGRWHQVRFITLPGLAPTIIVLLILNVGHILDAGFDQIYNLYNPLVYETADIIDTYVLRALIALDIGPSAAAGVFKSVVGMIMIVAANKAVRLMSRDEQGLF